MSTIILSILGVLAIIAIIAFTIWFIIRTPDNLEGFYCVPVIILAVAICIVLIGFIVIHVFL